MKKTRIYIVMLLMVCLCFALSACGGGSTENEATEPIPDSLTEEQPEQSANIQGADVLVVVFSATGTTKGVAEKIAAIEGADLYEIIAEEPYSDEDRNYNDNNSRTSREQNDTSVRPGIASESIDVTKYSKIYIGYPIWWGQEPRIMDTFVEGYDFGDITVIPFCTSGSSGIGKSGTNLANLAGSGNWIEGKRFDGGVSEDELRVWIEEINE